MAEKKNIENPYVGAVCVKGNRVILEKTPAGYCLATWDQDGPRCRISGFADEKNAKNLIPNRVCDENIFCNGGCGCGIPLIADDSVKRDERECANCGRFINRKQGCGSYVDSCMQTGSAYSNWIPQQELVYYAVEEISVKLVAVPKALVEKEAEKYSDSWSPKGIVSESLYGLWQDEKIVLTSDHFQEVNFKEVTEDSEYNYLLDFKESAQVIEEL